ncbi:hypothetical protein BGW37DRAFT_519930 [Umbelopsis sp. PMI_123]|nr:hypothetical protein BGW37DRAFT_519930 [Umbelopsis sp. PMI_123]
MLPASQTESSTDSSLISDVEQALDRVYLPTLPGEAPLQTEILETFELTIGNSVALTSENVVTYVNNHLANYVENRRLRLKTAISTVLQLFSLELYSPQSCSLVDGTEGLGRHDFEPGTWFLYVRRFAVPIQGMRDILEDWETADYFLDKAAIREDIISEQDTLDGLVYIRYVGQCQFPSTPEGRFAEDAASRNSGVLSHLLTSLANVCPEAYQAAKVLGLGTTFQHNVTADTVDDFEWLLIGLLGHGWLLNSQ